MAAGKKVLYNFPKQNLESCEKHFFILFVSQNTLM